MQQLPLRFHNWVAGLVREISPRLRSGELVAVARTVGGADFCCGACLWQLAGSNPVRKTRMVEVVVCIIPIP